MLHSLEKMLRNLDGKSYKMYKQIEGSYEEEWFQLHIDYVQGDPFAAPTRIRWVIPKSFVAFEEEWVGTKARKIAFVDYMTRQLASELVRISGRHSQQSSGKPDSHHGLTKGTGNSGLAMMDTPGQEMLERSSIAILKHHLDIRMTIGLPAAGRRILGLNAIQMLCNQLPLALKKIGASLDHASLQAQLMLADQQEDIRTFLRTNGYIAFVANGSILPRESGISNRPMHASQAVAFQSPASMEIEIPVRHRSAPIAGMGIRRGVTVIAGGGFHGKSTLLRSLERGVYPHIAVDGREFVITDTDAVKIRAEDGRSIERVNIQPFINHLPFGQDTTAFTTENASGSTSQAANIIEALEMGAKAILIDEDTSATNFMIRDQRMQALVHKEREPITPYMDHVRQLYEKQDVSTVIVTGGSGDYLEVSDQVIVMDAYVPQDATLQAREIVQSYPSHRSSDLEHEIDLMTSSRKLDSRSLMIPGSKQKVEAKNQTTIQYGRSWIDLAFLEQLLETSQTRAIAYALLWLQKQRKKNQSVSEAIDAVYTQIEERGLEAISPYYGAHPGDLAMPRRFEIAGALNRYRLLRMQ
ncbi:ABC-ATPase domain-containing protein [Marinicrinis sediminis]|uniref:ABC-ATPase domain-containing protein n=1 Tax=Marinicrinis sediminis TaxID=1652465 RepID=A0ABW5RGH0_9BACL